MKRTLSLFSIGLISFFGSISCAPDNPTAESARLESPVLVSDTQRISFKSLQGNNSNSWSLTDRIEFPNSGSFDRIQFKSRCLINEREFTATSESDLQSTPLFQALPEELLFVLDESGEKLQALCSVEFKASTPGGNIHQFSISHLKVTPPQEHIAMTLSEGKINSAVGTSEILECEGVQVELPHGSVELKDIPALPLQFKKENPSAEQRCRQVIRSSGRIVEVSKMFPVDFSADALESQWKIENRLQIPQRSIHSDEDWSFVNSPVGALAGTLELKNNSKFTLKLDLPNGIGLSAIGFSIGLRVTCSKYVPAVLVLEDADLKTMELAPGQVARVKYRISIRGTSQLFPPFAFNFPQGKIGKINTLPAQTIWAFEGTDPRHLVNCGVAL